MNNHYDSVLAVLPQTQCTQCGYQGCAPYAQAIINNTADINRCPPGGMGVMADLSRLTGMPIKPINPECGTTKPRHIAIIDPERCIGCTLCIVACPVDAIVGASKSMHQVINQACTGCDLCLPPCPVDCITMERIDGLLDWTDTDANNAKYAHELKLSRIKNNINTNNTNNKNNKYNQDKQDNDKNNIIDIKTSAQIAALSALERARARRK